MRVIPFVFAAFVASSPALAQGWEEYAYPDYAFSVAFPAKPQVEMTTYNVADNRSVPARLYSVRQGNVIFKMTVAELEGTNLEESAVVDHAIKTLSQGATVRVNTLPTMMPRSSPGCTRDVGLRRVASSRNATPT